MALGVPHLASIVPKSDSAHRELGEEREVEKGAPPPLSRQASEFSPACSSGGKGDGRGRVSCDGGSAGTPESPRCESVCDNCRGWRIATLCIKHVWFGQQNV
jgi:hypothetical protein